MCASNLNFFRYFCQLEEEEERYRHTIYLGFHFFCEARKLFLSKDLSSFLVLDGLLLGLLGLLLFLKGVVFWLIDVLSPSFSLRGEMDLL